MKDKISINNKGFTLVELLAVLAVLSVVVTTIIYTATHIVKNAKEKGYQTTINNIERQADNYVTEGLTTIKWAKGYDGTYEYQCVKVSNLIESGYFKTDVLDSYISKNRKVLNSDNIYLERDYTSKTITKNVLILDDAYDGLCHNISALGSIDITVTPINWAKKKTINIIYTLSNASVLSDYQYYYKYEPEVNVETETISKKEKITEANENISFEVNKNGEVNALIFNSKGEPLTDPVTAKINKIDNMDPYGSITQEGKNIKLNLNDDHSGVIKYYFGKNNPENNEDEWVSITPANQKEIDTTIEEGGIWYLGIEDQVGHQIIVSKEIMIDTTPPKIQFEINRYEITYDNNYNVKNERWVLNNNTWTKKIKARISVSDDESGLNEDTLKYAFSTSKNNKLVASAVENNQVEAKPYNNESEVFLEKVNGEYYLIAEACDNAGNCKRQTSGKLKLDNLAPKIECNIKVTEVIHYKRDSKTGEKTEEIYYRNPVIPREDTEECDAYHYMLFKKTIADYLDCNSVLEATDENGIKAPYCADKYYDDDGNTSCKKEGEKENCLAKATACNCIHDDKGKYCRHEKIYTVVDEAGNKTTDKFTYYYQYDDPNYSNSSLRETYCTEENLKTITESK